MGLLDGDVIMYRICFTINPEAELYTVQRHIDAYMNSLLTNVGCTHYIGIIGIHGGSNIKYLIFPDYKRGRPLDKPPHWNIVMNYLVTKWKFVTVSACETDDALRYCAERTSNYIIVSSDKDLLQIPGDHYIMGVTRKGKIVRENEARHVSVIEGHRNFYKQMLTGDIVDNVKACPGIGPKKAAKLLDCITDTRSMAAIVKSEYDRLYKEDSITKFNMNALLLSVNGDNAELVGFTYPTVNAFKKDAIELDY